MNYLKSQNADYIEELYARYLENPDSIDETWRYFFDGMGLIGTADTPETALARPAQPAPEPRSNGHAPSANSAVIYQMPAVSPDAQVSAEAKVAALIGRYREMGRLLADINPLEKPPASYPFLELGSVFLSEADLDRKLTAGQMIDMPVGSTLREILAALKETYAGKIGVEFTHVADVAEREWLQNYMEKTRNRPQLSKETKIRILTKLTEAEAFERFLHTRYVGQKRFSIEGGDVLIPMLDGLIDEVAELGALDMVFGMAHRGRLNVLTNIFGKKYEYVFSEFEGNTSVITGEGDVKYHMGYSSDYKTLHGKVIHLSLSSNPSHLEFVNPVVEGIARAKQVLRGDTDRAKVVPVLIHGDAAFAGQGVVYETIQLSRLRGYATGGTIHIVTNNQVGFTTDPRDSRSTTYATDLAKMLETPIFHVNGDDAEASYYVMQLAAHFRQRFHRDIVIDQICYRKYGHNEGDEPTFTQPVMYRKIKDHTSPREIYAAKLVSDSTLSQAQAQGIVDEVGGRLTTSYNTAKSMGQPPQVSVFESQWKGLRHATDDDFKKSIDTAMALKTLQEIGKRLVTAPSGFKVHPKLVRLLETRGSFVSSGTGIDWGTGEALAFGSLLWEGTHVRLSGQDCERGTFSHRHSVLYDFDTNESYVPLNHLKDGQGAYTVYNSCLSEAAVLGFEFGYSVANPKALTIWEAQFGDFANGAQVIIDQFIASSESKWQRMSGLVLLLPHGYEGQGPEHSSARLERYLQLCAKNNIQVGNFTTPAQLFHALRRQVLRDFRKPLIIMSPKSMLRNPLAVSKLEDFSDGGFQEILDDSAVSSAAAAKKVKRLVFCTGKVAYDISEAREKEKATDLAILRVEQLYPWPASQLAKILKKYPAAKEFLWVQEEPRNMGAWSYVRDPLAESLGDAYGSASGRARGSSVRSTSGAIDLRYVGRGPAAAPAVGSHKTHEKEQKALVAEAVGE